MISSIRRLIKPFTATHPQIGAARLRILRFAFRIFGVFALIAGVSSVLGHILGWFPTHPIQLAIYFAVAVTFFWVKPNRIHWVWPASFSPAIMGFAAAMQLDVMFAFVGIMFSIFGVSIWVGAWRD